MDPKFRTYGYPLLAILLGIFVIFTALPDSTKAWAPSWLQPTLHLGLDLQGGTQLDFRISETEMDKQIEALQQDIADLEAAHGAQSDIDDKKAQISNIQFLRQNIVEAIRTVLERRVNSLGVSEAVITPSYYGDEKHLLVECPGVIDVQQCINTVGKTILLEFKEQFEGEDEEHIATMRKLAEGAYARITESGETLQLVGQDLGPTLGVFYSDNAKFFQDALPKELADLWNRTPDDPVLFREVTLESADKDGNPVENKGIILAEVTGKKEEGERQFTDPVLALEYLAESDTALTLTHHDDVNPDALPEEHQGALDVSGDGLVKVGTNSFLLVTKRVQSKEEMAASHILIAYKGAVRADASVTRTKEEAKKLADDIKKQLDEGANFEQLARTVSDGPSGAEGGSLGTFGRGTMAPGFEQASFALTKGQISDVIETEFGYHIIRADSTPAVTPGSISYLEGTADSEAKRDEAFTAMQNKDVTRTEEEIPVRTLFFSFLPTGWKDTALDGKHFRRATVTTDSVTGIPVVQIVFDEEGGRLFQELTKNNVGKPIAIFVGGELISAPTVQGEIPGGVAIITGSQNFDEANRLAQDLNTGAIPAPIHLVGQVTVEATLGKVALQQSINAALIGFLLVILYMIWYYRVLGVIASIALAVYAIIFTALLKLPLFFFTNQYVVLTLAGVAGIILSIGMAVDANVLIFERMKEELKKGKMLQTAADTGFRRAWSSIRDSNISTLLTAAILFIIGSSIVRGFAVTLSLGIIISMFTAVVVTRFLIRLLYKSPIAENAAAFGVRANHPFSR